MIEVSGVFFLLFLRVIQRVSGVTLDKLSPCPDKTETLKLSLWISISGGGSILVFLLDKLVLGIFLDLSTLFSVSFIWVDLYVIELDQSTIHSFLGKCCRQANRRATLSALWIFIHQGSCKNLGTAVAYEINSRVQIRCLTSVNTNSHKSTAHLQIVMLINQQPCWVSNTGVVCWYPPLFLSSNSLTRNCLAPPFVTLFYDPAPKWWNVTLQLNRPSWIFLCACTFLVVSTF